MHCIVINPAIDVAERRGKRGGLEYLNTSLDVVVLSSEDRQFVGGDVERTVAVHTSRLAVFDGSNCPPALEKGLRKIRIHGVIRPFVDNNELRRLGDHRRGELVLTGNGRDVLFGNDSMEHTGPRRLS